MKDTPCLLVSFTAMASWPLYIFHCHNSVSPGQFNASRSSLAVGKNSQGSCMHPRHAGAVGLGWGLGTHYSRDPTGESDGLPGMEPLYQHQPGASPPAISFSFISYFMAELHFRGLNPAPGHTAMRSQFRLPSSLCLSPTSPT